MIDTAGTICQAAEALKARGAKAVIAAATHPVLSGPAIDRLKATEFEEVIVTNTLPIPEERRFDTLTVLSIAPLIARAIREVFEDGSVTSLFNGHGVDCLWPALRAAVPDFASPVPLRRAQTGF